MGIFKKTPEPVERTEQTAVTARASRLPDPELHLWFDNYVMLLGQAFDAFARHDMPLEEVGLCLDSLNAMYTEMKHRQRMNPVAFDKEER